MARKQKTKNTKMASRINRQAKSQSTTSRQRWFVGVGLMLGLGVSAGSIFWWYNTSGLELHEKNKQTQVEEQQLMPIRLVEIQGNLEQVSKEQLLAVLRSQSRKTDTSSEATELVDEREGINFLTTDLIVLEQQLKQIPWIYEVKVRRVWPDKLVLEVQEQVAIAYWNDDRIVNQFGDTFTPEVMPEGKLPVLTGPESDLAMMLKTFADLQQDFEAAELQLHELHLSERRSWHMKLANGIELQLGRKELQVRVNRFIDLYPMLVNENKAPIERVDLRYDTGLAVLRMETTQQQASL